MQINIEYTTIREQIVASLRNDILDGKYEVGERINEVALSKKYGVSRGPIREALRQIEQEGLVEYERNKGCTVTSLDRGTIYESSAIRCSLECLAVEMAECRFSNNNLSELEEIVDNLSGACQDRDINKLIKLDEDFHAAIVKNSKSQKLYHMWKSLEGEMAAIFYFDVKNKKNISYKTIKQNHQNLLNYLRKGNVEETVYVIKEHYMGAYERQGQNQL